MSGKVEGLVAKWRKDAEGRDEDGIYWQGHSQRMHMLSAADQLEAALAADAQSVAAGGEVDDAMVGRLLKELTGRTHIVPMKHHLKAALTAALATQHGENT